MYYHQLQRHPPIKSWRKLFRICKNIQSDFFKKSQLPTNFRKEKILFGKIKITLHDEESLIKTDLKALLEGTGINVSDDCDIEILLYAAKRLSIPHVVSDFTWNGEQIRANVGHGKLYVMVSSNKVRIVVNSIFRPSYFCGGILKPQQIYTLRSIATCTL